MNAGEAAVWCLADVAGCFLAPPRLTAPDACLTQMARRWRAQGHAPAAAAFATIIGAATLHQMTVSTEAVTEARDETPGSDTPALATV